MNCLLCHRATRRVSAAIGICGDCLRERFADAQPHVAARHAASRSEFDLPIESPRNPDGVRCTLCANECVIGEGERGVRVCWETNGTMHPKLLDAAVQYSLDTGGCIKFDLKAFDEELHRALTGISNRRTLENFARAARRFDERPDLPLVIASTPLVPGYVDAKQVGKIARFIAALDPRIPYALLAFTPSFYMSDLPCTSTRHAQEAEAAARDAGLVNVRVGNLHLLGARDALL